MALILGDTRTPMASELQGAARDARRWSRCFKLNSLVKGSFRWGVKKRGVYRRAI